ncbi:MAG: hypothetical protein ABI604_11120 [Nitrospirota bacterium]
MRQHRFLFALCLLGGGIPWSFAYEIGTHSAVTVDAYARSVVSSPALWERLGIHAYMYPPESFLRPFGVNFLEMGNSLVVRNGFNEYDVYNMVTRDPFNRLTDSMKVPGWLVRGVIREDDHPRVDIKNNDDPQPLMIRVVNHFFDPANNSPATFSGVAGGLPLGKRSPDWALGVVDAFAATPQEDVSRKNHYSVADAREALWRAMTLKDRNFQTIEPAPGMNNENTRRAYWATMFRALGNVIHLVQDKAQPQHARNEPHSEVGSTSIEGDFTGHMSYTEYYTEARTLRQSSFKSADGVTYSLGVRPSPIVLDGYTKVPEMRRMAEYFSTSLSSNVAPGYGLADYSNRGFLTQMKNIGNTDLSRPSPSVTSYVECEQPALDWQGDLYVDTNLTVEMFCGDVEDQFDPSKRAVNVPMGQKSMWAAHLGELSIPTEYDLNRQIVHAQADLLLPRAVAYSVGTLNHFFRGVIEVKRPRAGLYAVRDHATVPVGTGTGSNVGFDKIRVRLRNASAPISPPNTSDGTQEMGAGKLVAVLTYHRNQCYNADLTNQAPGNPAALYDACRGAAEEITVSDYKDITSLSSSSFTEDMEFSFPDPLPINATDIRLHMVFRGRLGSEVEAIAVGVQDLSEPTYLSFMNSQDYIWIGGAFYTRSQVATTPALLDLVADQSCVQNNQLLNGCLESPSSSAVSITLTGEGETTKFSMDSLPLREHFRVAYLTDVGTDTFKISGDCMLSDQTLGYPSFVQQLNLVTFNNTEKFFDSYEPLRGVQGYSAYTCVLRGGTQSPPAKAPAGMGNVPNVRPTPLTTVKWGGA